MYIFFLPEIKIHILIISVIKWMHVILDTKDLILDKLYCMNFNCMVALWNRITIQYCTKLFIKFLNLNLYMETYFSLQLFFKQLWYHNKKWLQTCGFLYLVSFTILDTFDYPL